MKETVHFCYVDLHDGLPLGVGYPNTQCTHQRKCQKYSKYLKTMFDGSMECLVTVLSARQPFRSHDSRSSLDHALRVALNPDIARTSVWICSQRGSGTIWEGIQIHGDCRIDNRIVWLKRRPKLFSSQIWELPKKKNITGTQQKEQDHSSTA